MHDLAHFIGRQEQVVAAAAVSGRRKPKPLGLAMTTPGIRSICLAGAKPPRRFCSNWPSRTIAPRRLPRASKRSGAVSWSLRARSSAVMRAVGGAEHAQDGLAAGDGIGVALGLARSVRVAEIAARVGGAGWRDSRRIRLLPARAPSAGAGDLPVGGRSGIHGGSFDGFAPAAFLVLPPGLPGLPDAGFDPPFVGFFVIRPWYTPAESGPRSMQGRVDILPRNPENARLAPARVAELVDALASGASGGNFVEVRVLSRAPA